MAERKKRVTERAEWSAEYRLAGSYRRNDNNSAAFYSWAYVYADLRERKIDMARNSSTHIENSAGKISIRAEKDNAAVLLRVSLN